MLVLLLLGLFRENEEKRKTLEMEEASMRRRGGRRNAGSNVED